MVNEKMAALGRKRNCIRELFEYGLRQAQIVGRENVYDYSLGNPSIPAPPEVGESFAGVLRDMDGLAVHGYTPGPGLPEARAAVAADLNARFSASIRPENIFLTCGAAPALVAVVRALANGDSEFLCQAPYFPEYRPFVEMNGGVFLTAPADTDSFQINLSAVAALIGPRTQALILNSPNNPSGVVYTEETLRSLAALLTEKSGQIGHPIYLIADEPYRELAYDGIEVPFLLVQIALPARRAHRLRLRPGRRRGQRGRLRGGRRRGARMRTRLRALPAAAGRIPVHGGPPGSRRIRPQPHTAVRRAQLLRLCLRPSSGRLLHVCQISGGGREGFCRQSEGIQPSARARQRVCLPWLCPAFILRLLRDDQEVPAGV